MCLSALPRKLAAEETADVPTATVAAAETGSSEIADTLREEGSLVKRIGFTKEQAPRLLLLCLMLEADELAGWVLHWIDACMPIASTPAEAGASKDGKSSIQQQQQDDKSTQQKVYCSTTQQHASRFAQKHISEHRKHLPFGNSAA
ncbi:uncharacterized protein EMH_0097270 [Eimeria mitis]|uniref:Uncharacterized protein n=1 Tax=Eimeria mitis TaxID=44415 RepID=U6KJ84_9EIME|nr:uncharacterized protein EMH_0097270 [Eimeria mitis]CDJ36841.1 hypothetical protein EMH_0097270 [Eimeria mitis]